MAPRRLLVESAARKDLRGLPEYSDSALARIYLMFARSLDCGIPVRDAAAASREMRLIFLTLRELSPPKAGQDYPDEIAERREQRMRQNGTR
jgi:hypothetical protein